MDISIIPHLQADANKLAPATAYLATMHGAGQRSVQSDLRKIARLLGKDDWRSIDWRALNAANVAALLARIPGTPATRNRARATLRGVARMAWRMGFLSLEELSKINDIPPIRGSREPMGKHIEDWEIAALLRACANDKTIAGRRDAAMIALAAKTGMRRAEIVAVKLDDVKWSSAGDAEIRVVGKGDKERIMYLDNGAAKALSAWLVVRGNAPGFLFGAIERGAVKYDRPLSTVAAHKMLAKRACEAGIPPLSWHDFRCTVAGKLLDLGEDILTIAGLLGHSSPNTTARYDRRPAKARRRAASRISVPYFEP